jgi:hypothetical protein
MPLWKTKMRSCNTTNSNVSTTTSSKVQHLYMSFSGRPVELPHGPLCDSIAAVAAALPQCGCPTGSTFPPSNHLWFEEGRMREYLLHLPSCSAWAYEALPVICCSLFAGLQCNTRTADVDFISLLKPTAIASGRALRMTWRCGVLAQNFPSSSSSMACHLM